MPDRPGHTPRRTIRVPDELWEAAKAKAESEGMTISEVVVRALQRYVRRR